MSASMTVPRVYSPEVKGEPDDEKLARLDHKQSSSPSFERLVGAGGETDKMIHGGTLYTLPFLARIASVSFPHLRSVADPSRGCTVLIFNNAGKPRLTKFYSVRYLAPPLLPP